MQDPHRSGPRAARRAGIPTSPDVAAFGLGAHHGRPGLAAERLLELRQVRQRSDHAKFADRVRVALRHQARGLRPHGVAAELAPRDEELLIRREAVDVGQRRLALLRDLERTIGDPRTGEIPDRLPGDELALVVDPRRRLVRVELAHDAGRLLLELLEVLVRPPVLQPALRVVLRALVVEPVADLVPDDDADRAVVDGVVGGQAERRRLQDPGREDDLVQERVVVRVGRRRRQAPPAAVDGLADGGEIVPDVNRRPASTSSQYDARVIATAL